MCIMRIAIIGTGTAGVSILRELVKNKNFSKMHIDAYDSTKNIGQGIPFQNDSEQLLINLPAEQMSLNLDNKREFFNWYEHQSTFKYKHPEYLPRFLFGHYMKSFIQKYNEQFENIHLIEQQVQEVFIEAGIGQTNVIYNVCTSEEIGKCKKYDVVFLTIGTMSYHDPYQLKGKKGYIHTPYPTYNTLDEVDETERIAVVGTGLASLDVIRYVVSHHPNLPITMTSRKGQLPSVRGEMPEVHFEHLTPVQLNQLKKEHFGNAPLEKVIKLFLKDCARYDLPIKQLIERRVGNPIDDLTYDLNHPIELGKLQSLLENAKENLNWIWNSLSRKDQKRFLSEYSWVLKDNSNPMPPETARLLVDYIQSGQIEIKSGLENIEYDDKQFHFEFKDQQETKQQFDVVINATGSKTQLADLDEDDQLIINMENRQVIQAHPLGGIQILAETNQVISPRYGTLDNMYAIGQLTNGINQSRNGVTMIVKQAVNVVKHLTKNN